MQHNDFRRFGWSVLITIGAIAAVYYGLEGMGLVWSNVPAAIMGVVVGLTVAAVRH